MRTVLHASGKASPELSDGRKQIADALAKVLGSQLRPVALGLGLLSVTFAITQPAIGAGISSWMSICAAGTAIVLLSFGIYAGCHPIPSKWVHPAAAGMVVLILLNCLVYLYLAKNPRETILLMLLAIGIGIFFCSALWLAVAIGATIAGWGLIAWKLGPSIEWAHFGFALLTTSVVAGLIQVLKIRSFSELEKMRAQDELSRAKLEETNTTLSTLIEASPLPIIAVDVDCNVKIWNTASERIFGWRREEMLDQAPPIIAAGIKEQFTKLFDEQLDGTRVTEVEVKGLRKDGSDIDVSISAATLRNETGAAQGIVAILADITERKRVEERLLQLQKAVETTQIGVTITDLGGTILYTNRAEAEMHGYTIPELVGRDVRMLAAEPVGHPMTPEQLTSAKTWKRERMNRRADGTVFPVRLTSDVVRSVTGNAIAIVTCCEDVSERHAMERMKDEFISTVSHELRTPLTSIHGALKLLANGLMAQPKGNHMLQMATNNVERLVRLVNDILCLERIDSLQRTLQKEPCDIRKLLGEAITLMSGAAEEAGVTLIADGNSGHVLADSDAAIRVLTNLIGNAIKFSPRGATVTISVAAQDSDWLFAVADEGRGIPADKLGLIFERFQQVDSSDSRQKGGTGLGLAICARIVSEHGGRIWAESKLGLGSTFYFTLPRTDALEMPSAASLELDQQDASSNSSAEQGLSSPATQAGAMLKVLVIDDAEDVQSLVKIALETSAGWQVVTASSGQEGLSVAATVHPSVILLDVMMPDMDGPATLNMLRNEVSTRDVPVIFLTAKLQPSEQLRFRNLGVDGVIAKPFNPLSLAEQIIRIIKPTVAAQT